MTTLQVHSFGLISVSYLFQLYSSAMEKTGAVTGSKPEPLRGRVYGHLLNTGLH